MALTVTELRANLYKIVDRVIETGVPVEIDRKGEKVRLVPVRRKGKLERLQKHRGTIVGDPEELVHLDWSGEWTELKQP